MHNLTQDSLITNNYQLIKENNLDSLFEKKVENKYSIYYIYNKLENNWKTNLHLTTKFGPVRINSLKIVEEFEMSGSISSVEEAIEYFWNRMN